MFDLPSFRIGRVFGIPIEINATWLIIFGFVSFAWRSAYFPSVAAWRATWQYAVVAMVSAAAVLRVARPARAQPLGRRARGGVPINRVTLFLFGGVSQMEEEPHTPGREFVMAFAGPAMSLLLGARVFVGCYVLAARWRAVVGLGAPGLPCASSTCCSASSTCSRASRSTGAGCCARSCGASRRPAEGDALGRSGRPGVGWSMIALFGVNLLTGGSLAGGHPLGFIWLGLIGWFITTLAGDGVSAGS